MAAIFGVFAKASDQEIEAMSAKLQHRGNRRAILKISDTLTLGAIGNDPEAALYADNDIAIVCDTGPLNLHSVLEKLHPQSSEKHAPNAVAAKLHQLYLSCGVSALESLKGNFSIVVVDLNKQQCFIARDFFGSVPIYLAPLSKPSPDGLAFASEYKALLCLPGVDRMVDRDALQHLQCNKNTPPLRTLIQSIQAPPYGAVSSYDNRGKQLTNHPLPPLMVNIQHNNEAETVTVLADALTQSVARQCQDNERIGIALSGGIDSISVACIARKLYPNREIHTFTAGNGPDDPEIITAARVAKHINATHHEIISQADLLNTDLRSLIHYLEDPIARSEVMQLFEIGKIAGDYVDVVISGQGADSLFGGMPRYKLLWLMKPLLNFTFLRKPLTEFYNRTQLGLKPTSLLGKMLDGLYYKGNLPAVPRVLGAQWPQPITLPPVSDEFVNINMARGFQKGQNQDFPKYERCFAVSGVSYRSPFCDEQFARIGYTISDKLKIYHGAQKYILRRAMKSIVPNELLEIPKYMQSMNHDETFSDILDSICDQILSQEAVKRRGFFNFLEIQQLRQREPGKQYNKDRAMRLWTLLCCELWAQEFLDQ